MSVHCLREKRFESAKEKVHLELVNYFVNLDEQRRLWYFTLAIRSHAQGHHFSLTQAEQLVGYLAGHCGIGKANIESALAFNCFISHRTSEKQKIVRLEKGNIPNDDFEEQISVLYSLLQEKSLEYRQALELVLIVLNHYPTSRRVLH